MEHGEQDPQAEFPEADAEATTILVVSDVQRSVEWWVGRIGARLERTYGGDSAVMRFAGTWLLLVAGGPPTADKPTTTFEPPHDPTRVSHAVTVRVADCRHVHDVLAGRGVTFFTPPTRNAHEVRCFTADPDGHLLEFSELV